MNFPEFYIDEQRIDLDEEEGLPISFTFQLDDVSDLTKRKGPFSRTFNIPATANNRQIIGNVYDLTSLSSDEIQRRDCYIQVDGNTIVTGTCVLLKVIGRREPETYNLQIFSNNVDWFVLLKERDIHEIDLGLGKWDETEIVDGWNDTYLDRPEYFVLVHRGRFVDAPNVRIQDMFPSIYLKNLVDAVWANIGYRVSSAFLDSADWKKQVIYACSDWRHRQGQIDFYSFRAEKTADEASLVEPGQPGVAYLVGYFDSVITDPAGSLSTQASANPFPQALATQIERDASNGENLLLRIRFSLIVRNDSGTSEVYSVFLWRIDGSDGDQPWEGFLPGIPLYQENFVPTGGAGHIQTLEDQTAFIEYAAGDQIALVITRTDVAAPFAAPDFSLLTDSILVGEHSDQIQRGQYYDVVKSGIKPGLTQATLIKGIAHSFNLYFQTDIIRRTISIEPRDSFYATGIAEDWEAKRDTETERIIEFVRDTARYQRFSYKPDDNDNYVAAVEKAAGKPLYSATYDMGPRFLDETKDNQNEFFAATHHYRAIELRISPFAAPIVPRIWGEVVQFGDTPSDNIADFEPRILTSKGFSQTAEGTFRFEGVDRTGYPKAFMVDYEPEGLLLPTLAFGDEVVKEGTERGLVFRYYLNHLATLREGRMIEMGMRLSSVDIANLDLSSVKYMEGAELYLYKVKNYRPGTSGSTQCEFIKRARASTQDEDRNVSAEVNGIDDFTRVFGL